MLLALLVVLACSFVLAGWVILLASQTLSGEEAATAQKRRLAVHNSEALARQYVLQTMGTSGGVSGNASAALPNGWGSFSLANGTVGAWIALKSVSPPTQWNPFSPFGPFGYTVNLDAALAGNATRSFQIRSRSPLFGGYPLTLHQPAPAAPGGLTANKTLSWPQQGGFPATPITSGETVNGTFSGYLPETPTTSLIGGVVTISSNSTGANITESGGFRNVSVDLGLLNIASLPTAALIHYEVPSGAGSGNLTGVRLTVQGNATAGNLPPVLLTFEAGALSLSTVTLQGASNSRRVYLRVSNPSGFTLTGVGNWRLGMTFLNNTTCTMNATGGLILTGGIRTNGTLRITSGTVSLSQEDDPAGLEGIVDRAAWLESFSP